MKTTVTTTLLVLTFLIGLQTAARAEQILTVNVPHDFIVNNTSLSAGSYIVSRSEAQGTLTALVIRQRDGGTGSFVLPTTFEGSVTDKAQLSFDSTGGVYTLSKIETPLGVYTFARYPNHMRTASKGTTKPSSGN
jgi:hypothetical protein